MKGLPSNSFPSRNLQVVSTFQLLPLLVKEEESGFKEQEADLFPPCCRYFSLPCTGLRHCHQHLGTQKIAVVCSAVLITAAWDTCALRPQQEGDWLKLELLKHLTCSIPMSGKLEFCRKHWGCKRPMDASCCLCCAEVPMVSTLTCPKNTLYKAGEAGTELLLWKRLWSLPHWRLKVELVLN